MWRRRRTLAIACLLAVASAQVVASAPPNDECADAVTIAAVPFTDAVDTTTATASSGDPGADCDGVPDATRKGSSVWYRYVAPAPVRLEVDTAGSDYDTLLVAYQGSCGPLVPAFCNADPEDTATPALGRARMLVTLGAGEEVTIEASGEGTGAAGGRLVVRVVESSVFQASFYPEDAYRPRIAAGDDGRFLVTWIAEGAVKARLFDAAGAPQGAEFVVNEGTGAWGYYDGASVASDGAGGFVVAWNEDVLLARRVDGGGGVVGDPIELDDRGYPYEPHLAADAAGNLVAVWMDEIVKARRFDASGRPRGRSFHVSRQYGSLPRVAASPRGEFMVVWTDQDYLDGDEYGVFGRRFRPDGKPAGPPFQVNVNTPDDQGVTGADVTALPGGDFVVVWSDGDLDYVPADQTAAVFARRFDASGRAGTPFRVTEGGGSGANYYPAIASDAAGNFVVVWNRAYAGPYGRRFTAAGTPVGGTFRAGHVSTFYQYHTDVAAAANGEFVVVWDHLWAAGSDVILGRGFAGEASVIAPPLCPPEPVASCREPAVGRKGTLRLVDKRSAGGDSFRWRWVRGEATPRAAFGDPTVSTGYRLCVWDGRPATLLSVEIPAGGTCGERPCWKAGRTRLRYADETAARAGIRRIVLEPGPRGVARIAVRGTGQRLRMPDLPPALPLTAQLLASNGECWSARFEPAGVVTSRRSEFSAKASLGSTSGAFVE